MIDFTTLLLSLITGIFSILSILLPVMINARMKDKAAAETLAAAVKNSLGAGEQAAKGIVVDLHPTIPLPAGVPATLAVQVQYVLDHAGDEAARFGITPEAIAAKVNAQMGLVALAKTTQLLPPVVTVPPVEPIATRVLA